MADTAFPAYGPRNPIDQGMPGPRAVGLGDDGIISMWLRRQATSQLLRQPYEAEWIKNYKAYRSYIEQQSDPADWWRSNVFVSETFNSVETILPRYVLGMFAKPEWFDVNCLHSAWSGHDALGANCAEYEAAVKSLLMAGTRRMNLFEPAYMGSKNSVIQGHSWYKLKWDREFDMRAQDLPVTDPMSGELMGISSVVRPSVIYDDPKLEWISNFRLWPDPTGNNEWFIEEVETTFEKLDYINRMYGGQLYRNLDSVRGQVAAPGLTSEPTDTMRRNVGMSSAASSYYSRENEILAVEGVTRTSTSESFDGPTVKLLICSGRVPYDSPDGIVQRRQVIANDQVIIRDEVIPTPDLKPEYFGVPNIPIPGFVYGDSVVRYIAPLNDQLNRIENFRMDEVVLGIWQQYIGNRNATADASMLLQPGGIIWIDTQQDVQTAFRVLERRPVLPQAYQEAAVKRDQIERTSAATSIQQGSTAADRETATSVGARVQLGNERFRLAIMWQNFKFKRELLNRMFKMYQRNLPSGRLVRLVGGDQQIALDISMLQDDVDISIDADVTDLDTAANRQALAFFMQTAAQPPFAQWWKIENLLPDVVSAYLEKDGRKYVRTHEEMAALAAQAQAQMFASSLGGHGAGPGQPGIPPAQSPGGARQFPLGLVAGQSGAGHGNA